MGVSLFILHYRTRLSFDTASSTHSSSYHTLSYDRLGVGSSTIADPLHSVQAFLEVSVLAELTRLLRTGRFPSAPQAPLRYERVLHVGHSFGAILTSGLVNLAPELSDGIALTGYTASGMYLPYFVAGGNFQLASLNEPRPLARPPGYMIAGNMRASQYLFFLEGAYDPAILPYAERAKQTVTQGELLTIGGLAGENRYPGPVYVVTGGMLIYLYKLN